MEANKESLKETPAGFRVQSELESLGLRKAERECNVHLYQHCHRYKTMGSFS